MAKRKKKSAKRRLFSAALYDVVFWLPPCDETETMYVSAGTGGRHPLDRPVVQITGRPADLRRIATLLRNAR